MAEPTPATAVKRCSGCKQLLPASSFTRNRAQADGLAAYCRPCISAKKKQYYIKDREKIRARSRRYRTENREQLRERKRLDHIRNRERNLARSKRWHEANPERSAAIKRRYYAANRSAAIARTAAWIKAHPAEKAERQRRDRARKLATSVARITPDLLAGKLAYWGWRCWLCGGEPTTWDHVKPSTKGGPHILANLRPACQPCNTRKLNRWPFPTHRRI